MRIQKILMILIISTTVAILLTGCFPTGPCYFSGSEELTVYRLPDPSSDIFGVLPAGQSHQLLAYTADGWIGFDPGYAQAGNIGLAHHRWVRMNATIDPSCYFVAEEVTLADVMVDMAASGH